MRFNPAVVEMGVGMFGDEKKFVMLLKGAHANVGEEVLDLVSMQNAAAPRKGVHSYVYYAWDT